MLTGGVKSNVSRAGPGQPGRAGPGRAGTVWSSIWDPFLEAKLELDLGAISGGPNHLFSVSLSSGKGGLYGSGMSSGMWSGMWSGMGFAWRLAFQKNVSEWEGKGRVSSVLRITHNATTGGGG